MSLPHCVRALDGWEEEERPWQAALSPFADPREAFARAAALQRPTLEQRARERAKSAAESS